MTWASPAYAARSAPCTASRSGPACFLGSLAAFDVRGLPVDWKAVFPDDAKTVDLPTYAFAHKRYWAAPPVPSQRAALSQRAVPSQRAGEPAAPDPDQRTGHPYLDLQTRLAAHRELVLTGRLSLGTQPWIADHMVPARCCSPAPGSWTPRCTRHTWQAPVSWKNSPWRCRCTPAGHWPR